MWWVLFMREYMIYWFNLWKIFLGKRKIIEDYLFRDFKRRLLNGVSEEKVDGIDWGENLRGMSYLLEVVDYCYFFVRYKF